MSHTQYGQRMERYTSGEEKRSCQGQEQEMGMASEISAVLRALRAKGLALYPPRLPRNLLFV